MKKLAILLFCLALTGCSASGGGETVVANTLKTTAGTTTFEATTTQAETTTAESQPRLLYKATNGEEFRSELSCDTFDKALYVPSEGKHFEKWENYKAENVITVRAGDKVGDYTVKSASSTVYDNDDYIAYMAIEIEEDITLSGHIGYIPESGILAFAPDESYKGLPLSYPYIVTENIGDTYYDSVQIELGKLSDYPDNKALQLVFGGKRDYFSASAEIVISGFKLELYGTESKIYATGTIKEVRIK